MKRREQIALFFCILYSKYSYIIYGDIYGVVIDEIIETKVSTNDSTPLCIVYDIYAVYTIYEKRCHRHLSFHLLFVSFFNFNFF